MRTKLTPLRIKDKENQFVFGVGGGSCGIRKREICTISKARGICNYNKEQNVLSKENTNQRTFKFVSKDSLQDVSKNPEVSTSLKILNSESNSS